MNNKVKYKLESGDYEFLDCVVEIDLDAEGSLHPSHYEDEFFQSLYGNSVKTEIVAMSKFWYGHPKTDDFERHLQFFLEVLGRCVGGYILDNGKMSSKEIHDLLNEEEGFWPTFGKGICIDVKSIMSFHDIIDDIRVTKLEEE